MSLHPSSDARHAQNQRRQSKQAGYACGWCRRGGFPDEHALFAHVYQRHEANLHTMRMDPTFDEQKWKNDFKARALTDGEIPSRQRHPERRSPPAAPAEPPSANSSQEYGLNRLSLRNSDSKKRSPTRKGEPPPGEDPGGPRTVAKRTKTSGSPSPTQSPRHPSTRSPRGSARGGRKDANQRSCRLIPDPRDPSLRPRDSAPGQTRLLDPSGTVNSTSTPGTQSRQITGQRQSVASRVAAQTNQNSSQGFDILPNRERGVIEMPIDPRYPTLYLQPDSRPISQEQLAAEVKSIYSGLTMVEAKCIHVDKAQAAAIQSAERGETELADDHWKALIALHRTLLHEHHDFFLASQHPSASPALQRLAAKYSMPARMWKHGIHSFLELLRYRLPDSLEYMISFIYFAYQMMSLLYETVPAFEDAWIECLGDLGRYRMAIEDEDFRDRETWAGVARFWYSKAADRSPGVGRLYHHLAILARPVVLQQLYLYCRSLTCVQPFQSARESITTLFDPVMGSTDTSALPISRIDTLYIKLHSILCLRAHFEDFYTILRSFRELLDSHITRSGTKWREEGAYVVISAIAALFEYGSPDSVLRKLVEHSNLRLRQGARGFEGMDSPGTSPRSSPSLEPSLDDLENPDSLSCTAFNYALDLLFLSTKLILRRVGDKNMPVDKNVLPFVNLVLMFLISLAGVQSFNLPFSGAYVDTIFDSMPWEDLCTFVNAHSKTENFSSRYESPEFPRPEKGDIGPLPEDYFVRGQAWTQNFYPGDWFKPGEVDDEERSIEYASTMRMRSERVFWSCCRLAEYHKWIDYDPSAKKWRAIYHRQRATAQRVSPKLDDFTSIREQYDIDMEDQSDIEADTDEPLDYSDASDDDSPEMLKLQKADRRATGLQHAPRDASQEAARLSVPSSELGPAEAAEEIMQTGFTVMVPDENLLLNQQDVFKILIERGWSIVIPSSEMAGLRQLSTSKGPKKLAADRAIVYVKTAIKNGRNIRILAEDGGDITGMALFDGEPAKDEPESKSDKEDVLITITRVASDLSTRGIPDGNGNRAKPALLVTESRTTRIKAKYQGVAAIATSMLRSVLLASISRRRSSSGSSIGRNPPAGSEMEIA